MSEGDLNSHEARYRPDARPYNPNRFSREFDRALARHPDLARIRLHDLRHTWATLALQAGVPVKIVSERLGHSTTSITSDTYSHVTPRREPTPPSESRASSSRRRDQLVTGDPETKGKHWG